MGGTCRKPKDTSGAKGQPVPTREQHAAAHQPAAKPLCSCVTTPTGPPLPDSAPTQSAPLSTEPPVPQRTAHATASAVPLHRTPPSPHVATRTRSWSRGRAQRARAAGSQPWAVTRSRGGAAARRPLRAQLQPCTALQGEEAVRADVPRQQQSAARVLAADRQHMGHPRRLLRPALSAPARGVAA